jgi:hypothetical protein
MVFALYLRSDVLNETIVPSSSISKSLLTTVPRGPFLNADPDPVEKLHPIQVRWVKTQRTATFDTERGFDSLLTNTAQDKFRVELNVQPLLLSQVVYNLPRHARLDARRDVIPTIELAVRCCIVIDE